ncbi:MAG: hypothetical protein K2L98_03550, partial [Bacilli bacterium]|nr:hypothetical protein [Bacilli bacterium]
MEYYYMDQDEIAIRTRIKNLASISTNVVPKTGKILLSCTTSDGLTLSFDNKSKHFPLFLDTLSRIYESEKDKRNIIIFDSYTEDLLREKHQKLYRENFDEHPSFENAKIDYQRYDLNSIMPIISELLAIMYAIEGTTIEEFGGLTGIRDHFTLRIKVFGKPRIIPIKFIKKDDFNYEIILGNVYGPKSLNAYLYFLSDAIKVSWNITGSPISGNVSYSIDSSIKELVSVIYQDQYICYNENEYLPLKEEELDESIKKDYPGYNVYRLINNLLVAVSIDGNKRDIHYISITPSLKKTRNCYQEETDIGGLNVPIVSSKKVIEEYPIAENLTLIQEFFTYIPYEGEYYNDVLRKKVQFRIIEDGIT